MGRHPDPYRTVMLFAAAFSTTGLLLYVDAASAFGI